jgi:3-hydroxybutyryl-CoA dehydratase
MEVSKSLVITQDLVNQFAQLSGDFNPIHIDPEYAKSTFFGKPIAHGMLVSSFFSTLIAQEYPGPGSIYLKQELNFLKPCFIDETINVVIKLITKEDCKYFLNTLVYNKDGKLIVEGTALILKK